MKKQGSCQSFKAGATLLVCEPCPDKLIVQALLLRLRSDEYYVYVVDIGVALKLQRVT